LIPYLIFKICKGLQSVIDGAQDEVPISAQVISLAQRMNSKFEAIWGSGLPGTVAIEHMTRGVNQRPKGIPLLSLLASLVDPRMKLGAGLAEEDLNYLWNSLMQLMIEEANSESEAVRVRGMSADNESMDDGQPGMALHDNNFLFHELNVLYHNARNNNNDDTDEPNNNNAAAALDRVRAELVLYKREPAIMLQREEGIYNNPLEWWKVKKHQYPLLSKVAIKLLAIPATSAPSERVFSSAGFTIANDRSRLDPDKANVLVFLHENRSSMKKFEDTQSLLRR
jgi:hypothetical protein